MKKTFFQVAVAALLTVAGTQANAQAGKPAPEPPAEIQALLQKHICLTCHKVNVRVVGPAYKDVAKKKYTDERIVQLIYKPEPANWPGYTAMIAMTNVPKEDAMKIAKWINSLGGSAAKGKAKAPAKKQV
ncbi:MAG: cytochrome C [Cytophagaceae bacterium]|nr:cytochrome C [Cytophagaceae bacterium]